MKNGAGFVAYLRESLPRDPDAPKTNRRPGLARQPAKSAPEQVLCNKKGLTLPADRYKKIFTDIILDAVRFGNTSKVKYPPAWLKHVMQTHFDHHGEEYYAEAKGIRAQAEHALLMLGKLPVATAQAVDPVRQLAEAGALLARTKPAKKPREKQAANLEFKL